MTRTNDQERTSAAYCRGCHPAHDVDGLCSYHALQFRKLNLSLRKCAGLKPLVVRKLGRFDYLYELP